MKNMKLFLIAFCSLLALSYAIDLTIVKNEIVPNCLNRLYDPLRPSQASLRPLANSMENFLSLVEKIERNHTDWDIYKVSQILLKRFAYDGINFEQIDGERIATEDSHYKSRSDIIDKLVPFRKDENNVFVERDLSDDEKCSMFLMLSHLMNDTYIEGDLEIEASATEPDSHLYNNKNTKKARFPREQGVVSLNGNQHHAIALGRVILGIVASQRYNENPTIGSLFEYLHKNHPDFQSDLKINPLLGVTLGDAVAHAALSKGHSSSPYGIGGDWNNTACTTIYRMNQHTFGTTRALVVGAIDGLLIGRRLSQLNGNSKTLSLSKVLRMYYSRLGFPLESGSSIISYCKRADFRNIVGNNDVVESIAAFYHVYYAKDKSIADQNSINKATENLAEMERIISQMNVNDEFCSIQPSDQPRCETKTNLFFVLDDSEARTRGFDLQEKTIGFLSNYFDIGTGGSSLSVFFNSRGGNNNLRQVNHLSYNATNKAAATCAASRIEENQVNQPMDEENMMHALNGTLQDFELYSSEMSYAPSKVVVIFKYGELIMKDEARVERASNIVRYGHRDTRVITVGSNSEALRRLSTSLQDVITGIEDPKQIAMKLATLICEVPSVLQYEECWNRRNRNEANNNFVGYVTPDHTQYMAMYPQYFLKSNKIQFKFNTEGSSGDLQICFSRNDVTPKESEPGVECRKSGQDGIRDITFGMDNPCHKYNINNCRPAYFAITGKRSSNEKPRCMDEQCRRIDQIKYTFSHEGVYCSGAMSILSSPYAVLLLVAAFFSKFYW